MKSAEFQTARDYLYPPSSTERLDIPGVNVRFEAHSPSIFVLSQCGRICSRR